MGLEYLSPLKKKVFWDGSVSYTADGCLSFDFSIWKKHYCITVCIQTEVSGVTRLLVRSDEKSIVLCHSNGILIIDTSHMLFMVMEMGETIKPLSLPEKNISFYGNVCGCCFNPQDNRLIHVIDSSYNFYSFDTETHLNRSVTMWRLPDVLPIKDKGHLLISTPVFMDVLNEDEDNLTSLFIVMQNGASIVISHISSKHLILKSSYPLLQSIGEQCIQFSWNECKWMLFMRRLEETPSFVLYCGVSAQTIYLIVYYRQDYRVQVLENHVFDFPVLQEDLKVDVYSRKIIVNDIVVSYQWVFDLLNGKDMWSKLDKKELPAEKLDISSSMDHQYDWWMYQSEVEIREARELQQSTKKELKDKFDVFDTVDVLNCTLAMLNYHVC